MVALGILDYQFIREGGATSLYAFGEHYPRLVDSRRTDGGDIRSTGHDTRSTGYVMVGQPAMGDGGSTGHGRVGQPDNKDNPIIDSSTTLDRDIRYIIDHLNEKAGTSYRPTTKQTKRLLVKLLTEGERTVEDCIKVIDNMCAKWLGTEWEQYLRPSTLFGDKFENYLNAKVSESQPRRGIRKKKIDTDTPPSSDLEDFSEWAFQMMYGGGDKAE